MGNSSPGPPPPSGERILRCKDLFMLKKENVETLWEIFKKFDLKREGLITRAAFFEALVKEERNEFGDAIFGLIDPEDDENIEFGEFVQAVCTFCCFSPADMLKFCFMVYDKDRSGHMEVQEFHCFIKMLHSAKISKNVQSAFNQVQLDDYGRLPFDSFERHTLGHLWWKRKTQELDYWRENRDRLIEAEKLKRAKKQERQRNAQIRKVMGLKEYFLNPKKRQVFVEALSKSAPNEAPVVTSEAFSSTSPAHGRSRDGKSE